ncbi:ribonuclease T2-like [Varicellaria rhodocarpa]|nr:ribonuclease T2-like [Varicellaria rhodocarpa]
MAVQAFSNTWRHTGKIKEAMMRVFGNMNGVNTFLADAGIYPSASKNYTYAEVAAAVSKPRGVTALVQCYHGQLDEVWYFYDVAGTIATGDFIPINPVGSTSSCPTTLQYLPKNLTSIAKSNDTAPPTPFVGSGYLLVESGGVEAGCINSAGKWSNSSPKSCATFQGASSGSGISLSSSKGACAIKNAKFKCGSNIAKSQLFTDISGNLAYTNRTSFYSSKAPNGTTQGGVYTKKHNVTLGITWEALSVEGFTL